MGDGYCEELNWRVSGHVLRIVDMVQRMVKVEVIYTARRLRGSQAGMY